MEDKIVKKYISFYFVKHAISNILPIISNFVKEIKLYFNESITIWF